MPYGGLPFTYLDKNRHAMPKLRLQTILYSVLVGCALLIAVISLVRESRHQTEKRLGLAAPTPVGARHLRIGNQPIVPPHTDYQLPSPGILPNHPLYILKMIRDRIRLVATTNKSDKTKLQLLYANKRIAAAALLNEAGYLEEALETATKAETYLFQAVMNSDSIPSDQQNKWFDELKRASLKHEEIIEQLDVTAPGFANNQAARLHQNLDQIRNQIVSISHQPFGYVRPEDNMPPVATESGEPRF
jgi:hypothetical protein